MPGFGLWVASVEVSEKEWVSQFKQAGSVVGHGIPGSRDVILDGQVAMMALMDGLHAKEIGGGRRSGDGAFVVPEEGDEVVGVGFDGPSADVKALDSRLMLEEAPGELKIRIGHGAVRLASDTRDFEMWAGNGMRQTMGTGVSGVTVTHCMGSVQERVCRACW
jgi:hypothetical protein